MLSGARGMKVRVGPKGGLFVYRNGESGAKRYLTGEAADYVADAAELRQIVALQTKLRAHGVTTSRKDSDAIRKSAPRMPMMTRKKDRSKRYGVLPEALPGALGLLVAEFLGGQIGDMTLEQRDLQQIVNDKCALARKTCIELLQLPTESSQETLLCRSGCLRRYKAVRAPIVEYLAKLPAGSDFHEFEVDFQLGSEEFKSTSKVGLSVSVRTDIKSGTRQYGFRLTDASRLPSLHEDWSASVSRWRVSAEHQHWTAIAYKYHMSTEESDEGIGSWVSVGGVSIAVAADCISDFLWSVERGTFKTWNAGTITKGRTRKMVAQVQPLLAWTS
jgi:hypothetical protein